ncbi:MAG: hypothetical protein MUQ10_03210 [Anaerolineae bacterium]|nr:hypothetical protein [Anaerolineae bacterium]
MLSWLVASIGLVSLLFSAIGRSLESGTWEGFFTSGRAGRIFRPCGSRATWWVQNPSLESTADELEQRYQEITSHPYEQVYVRIRGEASRKGQYGPLGSYQRVVYVQELLEVRAKQDTDCSKDEDEE